MEAEINSQPEIIGNLIDKYIVNYCFNVNLPLDVEKVVIVASGSSYNAGLFGKYFFENISNVECKVEYAAEFSNSKFTNFDKKALYIFISQSGNSTDTVNAISKVSSYGAKTLCITNNPNSRMFQMADYKFDLEADEEKAIASTKTFSASVLMLWIIACKTAQNRHVDVSSEIQGISFISGFIKNSLDSFENINLASKIIAKEKDFSLCGFGYNYVLAKEASLKIKELSYINTCAYPLGEFIHGYFAVLNKSKVLVIFSTEDCAKIELELINKIRSNYKIKTILITDSWEDYDCDVLVKIPSNKSKIATILNMIIAIQLISLNVAERLKRNIDKPKGLVKIVK